MTFFSLYIGKKGVKLMRVAVDGMGGDHSPSAVVEGCVQALEEFKDIEIYITGPEDLLKEAFSKFKYDKERVVFIDAKEVINFAGVQTAPLNIKVRNPAFDVTPNELITGFITKKGIIKPPYIENLKKAFKEF